VALEYFIIFILLVIVLGYGWVRLMKAGDAANQVDWGHRWSNRIEGLNRLFCQRYHRLRYQPITLPAQGGAIVVANHISGLDPLLLAAASPRPLRFLIAKEYYDNPLLTWLYRLAGCIPVERTGKPEQAFKAALQALRDGEVVALFPQGGIHHPKRLPTRLKTGAVRLAYLTQSLVYPVHISGVRGMGGIIGGVLLRSHARVDCFESMSCEKTDLHDCLERIKRLIEQTE